MPDPEPLSTAELASLRKNLSASSGVLVIVAILGVPIGVTGLTGCFGLTVPVIIIALLFLALIGAYRRQLRMGTDLGIAERSRIRTSVSVVVGRNAPYGAPHRFEFTTENKMQRTIGPNPPISISAIRFVQPVDKIIRRGDLPVEIHLQSWLRRQWNQLFGIKSPRVIIQGFTKDGVLFDEDHTQGASVIVDLYTPE